MNLESFKGQTKYIAVKPKHFSHYLWFECEEAYAGESGFLAYKGWGKSGCFIEKFECNLNEIESVIHSEALMY